MATLPMYSEVAYTDSGGCAQGCIVTFDGAMLVVSRRPGDIIKSLLVAGAHVTGSTSAPTEVLFTPVESPSVTLAFASTGVAASWVSELRQAARAFANPAELVARLTEKAFLQERLIGDLTGMVSNLNGDPAAWQEREARIAEMEKHVFRLQEAGQTFREDNARLTQEKDTNIADLNDKFSQLQEVSQGFRQDNAQLTKDLIEREAIIEELKRGNVLLRTGKKLAEKENEKLIAEASAFKAKVAADKASPATEAWLEEAAASARAEAATANEAMNQKIAALNQQIEKLQEVGQGFRQDNAQLTIDLVQSEETVQQLTRGNEMLRTGKILAEGEKEKLEAEISQLKAKASDETQLQLPASEIRLQDRRLQLEENAKLASENLNSQEKNKSVAELNQQIEQLQEVLQGFRQDNAQLTKDIVELEATVQQLTQGSNVLRTSKKLTEEQNERLSADVSVLKASIAALEAKANGADRAQNETRHLKLLEEKGQQIADMERNIEQLYEAGQVLRQQVAQLTHDNVKSEEMVQQLTIGSNTLRSGKALAEEEKAKLAAEVSELKASRKDVRVSNERVDQLMAENDHLTFQVTDLLQKIDTMNRDKHTSDIAEAGMQEKLELQSLELEKCEKERASLKADCDRHEFALSALRAQSESVRAELEAAQADRAASVSAHDSLRQELEGQLEIVRSELANLIMSREAVVQDTQEKEALQARVDSLTAEVFKLHHELQAQQELSLNSREMSAHVNQLQQENSELKEMVNRLSGERASDRDRQELEATVDRLSKECAAMEQSNMAEKRLRSELEVTVDRLSEETSAIHSAFEVEKQQVQEELRAHLRGEQARALELQAARDEVEKNQAKALELEVQLADEKATSQNLRTQLLSAESPTRGKDLLPIMDKETAWLRSRCIQLEALLGIPHESTPVVSNEETATSPVRAAAFPLSPARPASGSPVPMRRSGSQSGSPVTEWKTPLMKSRSGPILQRGKPATRHSGGSQTPVRQSSVPKAVHVAGSVSVPSSSAPMMKSPDLLSRSVILPGPATSRPVPSVQVVPPRVTSQVQVTSTTTIGEPIRWQVVRPATAASVAALPQYAPWAWQTAPRRPGQ